MITRTYPFGSRPPYKYVVVLSMHRGRIMLSRRRDRSTWETQGGKIEPGETPEQAARRELYEESGAVEYDLCPLCDYWVWDGYDGSNSGGAVFAANIRTLAPMPDSEMSEIHLFDALPENLSFPDITPELFAQLGVQ